MRARWSCFAFLGLAVFAAASLESLPSRVSSDVRDAVDRATRAAENGDKHLALALLEGSLYPQGITLAIDRSTVEHAYQEQAVHLAVGVWNDELSGDLPVSMTDDLRKADIVLSFVDSIDVRGGDSLGIIKLRKSYRWNKVRHEVSYKGTIKIVRSMPDGTLDRTEVQDVAMHEIGHLLGLDDSPHHGVLMGPMTRGEPLLRPTAAEVNDVRTLRQMLRSQMRRAGEEPAPR